MWIILLWSPPNPSHLMDPLASERWISTTCAPTHRSEAWEMRVWLVPTKEMCISRKVSRIGKINQTFSGKRRRMLERILQPGAVINPGRRANGGANPAQSVVVTSSGSGRATVWMERFAWKAEIIPTSEASGPSMSAAGLDVRSDKLVGGRN